MELLSIPLEDIAHLNLFFQEKHTSAEHALWKSQEHRTCSIV